MKPDAMDEGEFSSSFLSEITRTSIAVRLWVDGPRDRFVIGTESEKMDRQSAPDPIWRLACHATVEKRFRKKIEGVSLCSFCNLN